MVNGLYGFRQKPPAAKFLKTDDVVEAPDPRITPLGQPPVPTPTSKEPYHSGVSAENDDGGGPGSSISGKSPEASQASYANTQEAINAAKAGYEHGYYGTVQDAATAAGQGNQKAAGALGSFVQNTANSPSGFSPQAPGLLGYAIHAAGLEPENPHGGTTQNVTDAIYGLESAGQLYSDDNSSGYFGDTLTQQQNLSDIHNATVFGDWSTAEQGAPETFADDTQSFTDNYQHHQDNSSDDNGGQTDGTQTGGETSHGGGYGGFADDAASSDSGGGGK